MFGYISNVFTTNPSLHPKLPYDNARDFQPIAACGATPVGSTPEQFGEHLRRETAQWARGIKAVGIKPQ